MYSIKPENQETADLFLSSKNPTLDSFMLKPELSQKIQNLWEDPAIKEAFGQCNQYVENDATCYFLSNIVRISEPDFQPTPQDILFCRIKTSGIFEVFIEIDTHKMLIVDVGGQRSERRKWVHCFNDVTAIIFFVSLSDYDQTLEEAPTESRMKESILLFRETISCSWFENIPIILFFNKHDLFKIKIKKSDLQVCFPEYKGGCDRREALKFIKKQFENENQHPKRKLYMHTITATNTDKMRIIVNDIKHIFLQKNLESMLT